MNDEWTFSLPSSLFPPLFSLLSSLFSLPAASDERPVTPGDDCLWLLTFVPDQIHRSPLQGPLAGCRRRMAKQVYCSRSIIAVL